MTHDPKRWDDSGVAKGMKFWPLFVGLITFTFALGISSQSVKTIEKKAEKNEEINERQEARLAAQEQNIIGLNKRLDRMEDKLDKILKAVR